MIEFIVFLAMGASIGYGIRGQECKKEIEAAKPAVVDVVKKEKGCN